MGGGGGRMNNNPLFAVFSENCTKMKKFLFTVSSKTFLKSVVKLHVGRVDWCVGEFCVSVGGYLGVQV